MKPQHQRILEALQAGKPLQGKDRDAVIRWCEPRARRQMAKAERKAKVRANPVLAAADRQRSDHSAILRKREDPKAVKSRLRDECEALCKAVVRKRDYPTGEGNCISCGRWRKLQWGHFLPQRTCKWLQYRTDATAGQCSPCNGPEFHGNEPGYIKGLDARYGADYAYGLKAEAAIQKGFSPRVKDLEAAKTRLRGEAGAMGIDVEQILKNATTNKRR